jgi:tetratricopeptide (TPR) repeat protein
MPRLERSVDKHGFPIPPTIDDLPGRNAPRDTEQFGNVSFSNGKRELSEVGQRWKRRIIWLGIIGIAVGLLLSSFAKPLWDIYAHMRTEMGRRSLDDYDFESARNHFDAALSVDPTQLEARFYRGKALYNLQELDAANEDLTFAIDSKDERAKLKALDLRAMIHYRQQRADAAMRDADEAVRLNRHSAEARNKRAYLCALLGQDLKKGLADINLVLQSHPKHADNPAFLDTRGYLLFKQGENEAALRDIDRAVTGFEEQYQRFLDEQQRAHPGRSFNMTREEFAGTLKEVREGLGVIYYHRGEIYEALKRSEDAAREKARGKEYGYNPAQGVF